MESFFRNVSKWYVLIDDVYEVYYLIHYFTWMVVCVLRKWSTTFILLSSINKACSHGRRSTVVVPNPVVNGTYLSRRLRRGRKEGSNDASSFFFMTKRRGEKKKKERVRSMEYMSRMPHNDSRCIDTRAASCPRNGRTYGVLRESCFRLGAFWAVEETIVLPLHNGASGAPMRQEARFCPTASDDANCAICGSSSIELCLVWYYNFCPGLVFSWKQYFVEALQYRYEGRFTMSTYLCIHCAQSFTLEHYFAGSLFERYINSDATKGIF